MNSTAEDIKDLLVVAGIGAFAAGAGWSIHTAREPAEDSFTPATVITLYDTGSWQQPHPVVAIGYPTLMARVRAADYQAGWDKAEAIRNGMNGLQHQVISGAEYIACLVSSDVAHIGFDAKNRPLFTVNFQFTRVPTVAPDSNWSASEVPPSSTLRSITRVTGDYTALRTDGVILADTTAAAIAITLPDATLCTRQTITVKNVGASGYSVIVNGTLYTILDGQSIDFLSDGADWVVM